MKMVLTLVSMRLSSTSNHGWTGTHETTGQRLVGGSGPFAPAGGHGDSDATSGASDAGGHSDGAADATSGVSN